MSGSAKDRRRSKRHARTIEVYKDRASGWRWRITASNGKIVADSGEAYSTRSNAVRAAESARKAEVRRTR